MRAKSRSDKAVIGKLSYAYHPLHSIQQGSISDLSTAHDMLIKEMQARLSVN
jgi:hypothetical protein